MPTQTARYWFEAARDICTRHINEYPCPNVLVCLSLDKEFLRLWVRARCEPYYDPIPDIPDDALVEFSGSHIRLFETVTGLEFTDRTENGPVPGRVRRNPASHIS